MNARTIRLLCLPVACALVLAVGVGCIGRTDGSDVAGTGGFSNGTTSGQEGTLLQPAEDAQLIGLKFHHATMAMEPYYTIRQDGDGFVCSVTTSEVTWPEIDGEDAWAFGMDDPDYDPYADFGASVAPASVDEMAQLQQALEDAGVLAWNGYSMSYTPGEGVYDMDDWFQLKLLYSDGSVLEAHGSNRKPDGYSQVVDVLFAFFAAHEDRSASYPGKFPDAQPTKLVIDLGSPYGNGSRWRIELNASRKQWSVSLQDPFGTVLPKGTDVGDYGYVDSADELPFDQFMGILRAHDVESHNLESGWDGGGEGCHISIYFDNGQAFSMDTNKLPEDYEALREECAQAMADYYETVRDQGER